MPATAPATKTPKKKILPPPSIEPARIVKRVQKPLTEEEEEALAKRAEAGVYRIIHGKIAVSLPEEQRTPFKPPFEFVDEGCEVWLNADDATRLLEQNIIEPLNARPSRVGKVFTPPKQTR